jgi:hypothetical protein
MLVRTTDARYQAVRLRARLIASKARKAFCRQGLQGFAGFTQGSARQSLRQLSRRTRYQALKIIYIVSGLLHGSGDRHNEIS